MLARAVLALAVVLALNGCASSRAKVSPFSRPFIFGEDTFAYANELYWIYKIDPATGKMIHEWRDPKPTYAQHCFVVARSARQFFQHAHFDTNRPTADEATYRKLVRKVVSIDPRHELEPEERIPIPGYADLHSFSRAQEKLLKEECGSMWQSYFQRGNWRILWHFSKKHQEQTARHLVESIRRNRPPIVHASHFPRLEINHALLLYEAKETEAEIEFVAYDPNHHEAPRQLIYRKHEQRFYFPPQTYFAGGIVDIFEIYCQWNR